MFRRSTRAHLFLPAIAAMAATPAAAQQRLDRADPTINERSLPDAPPPPPRLPPAQVEVDAKLTHPRPAAVPRIATAIVVEGTDRLAPDVFAATIADYVGRDLGQDELATLATAIAGTARANGYPFATATIGPQTMADGILRVTLDEGRIDAVRVIGAINPVADRLLTRALVTGHAVRRSQLERAIQLVGDIPGVTVKDSRYTRQDGFGILLVTIAADPVSGYLQFDNRGTREVGPIRATAIANVRGAFQAGDEIGLIGAATPIEPSEFAFLRGRYLAPVDDRGSVMTVGVSYGRARPGGPLRAIDVVADSVDIGAAYIRPLLRSRARSLWGQVEFRAMTIDQQAMGIRLRADRLATLAGSINGAGRLGGGVLRGEAAVTGGLPLAGVTHEGDPEASRPDGDARFVTASYALEWTHALNRLFAVAITSSGQLASRPLLATAELGLGGPGFARAYDSAERTGDQGILGALELRSDLASLAPTMVDRLQLYAFVDGGYVDNLRDGFGGGSLASAGGGLRLGQGKIDAMLELAVPLSGTRFDTGDRRPRISARIGRRF